MITKRLILSASLVALGATSLGAQPLSPEESKILESLDPSRAVAMGRRLAEDVVENNSGAGAGTAVSGSADEKALADVIEKEMESFGLVVRRESFPVRSYDYGEVSLIASGKKIAAVTLHAGRGTWGSMDGVPYLWENQDEGRQLHATLVDAGEGFVDDYGRAGDVKGKVVLVRRTVWPNYVITEAAHRGASAILIYDYGEHSLDNALRQDSVWYRDQIPAVSITKADANALKEMLSQGEVEMELESRVDASYGFSENVTGMLRGSEFPEEWITVSAHHDRWFYAAEDDAMGIGSMLELARVLTSGYRPRRSLLFIAFGSEESGDLSTTWDWLAGSYAFVKAHPEITSRLAYGFNIEIPGWFGNEAEYSATLDNLAFQRKLLSDLGLDNRVNLRPGVRFTNDAWSLGSVGGGAVSNNLGWRGSREYPAYYHTNLEVFQLEDLQNLKEDLRLGALGVLRADQAIVVPIHFTEVAGWVENALQGDQKTLSEITPPISLEKAVTAARGLQFEAEKIESAFSSVGAPAAAPLNAWLMKTRKELVPWLLSTGGQGVLRTTRYASDLAALHRARLAAESGDGAGAASALEQVGTMSWGKRLSPEAYRAERLLSHPPSGWGLEYEHMPHPVNPELHTIYLDLKSGARTPSASTAARLGKLEAQAEGYLREAMFIITEKLKSATQALRQAPLPPSS